MSRGSLAGPARRHHDPTFISGSGTPASANVGRSGIERARLSPLMARARSLPESMNALVALRPMMTKEVCPATRSVSAFVGHVQDVEAVLHLEPLGREMS